jgi:hypothetical protein
VSYVDTTLEVLALTVFAAVLAFLVCRSPASDRQPSVRRFLAGAAIGLAAAIGPGIVDVAIIGGGVTLLLAPEQFVVPGIVMIAAGALLVDSEALRRIVGL